jgi:V8-like Glu-specific endopeptidase
MKYTGVLVALIASVCQGEVPSSCFTELRIVGGTETSVRELPFQVGLHFGGATPNQMPSCGGSLIAPNWVVTAAHCAGANFVSVGAHNQQDNSDPCKEIIGVKRQIMHPDYNSNTLMNDIMLLELDSRTDYTPIGIYSTTKNNLELQGTDLWISGWGTTSEGGSQSATLQKASVPVYPDSECYRGDSTSQSITTICAGFNTGGIDSCQGDSGGPLFGQVDGIYKLVGITSWGIGCAQAGNPGVYTRVSQYQDWITGVTEIGNPFTAAPTAAPTTAPTAAPTSAPTSPPTIPMCSGTPKTTIPSSGEMVEVTTVTRIGEQVKEAYMRSQFPCTVQLETQSLILKNCEQEACNNEFSDAVVEVNGVTLSLQPGFPVDVSFSGKSSGTDSATLNWIPMNSCRALGCTTLAWSNQLENGYIGFNNPDPVARVCYCDDACTLFKDCCIDYQYVCNVWKA